jgi:hypothetical protein
VEGVAFYISGSGIGAERPADGSDHGGDGGNLRRVIGYVAGQVRQMIGWLRERLPALKGQPIVVSWSWKCDPEIWLSKLLKRLCKKQKEP